MENILLPVITEVEWEGWERDKDIEIDLWEEMRALDVERKGWSERMLRDWLRLVVEEKKQRQRYWELVTGWFEGHGVMIGGENRAQERVYEAMVEEEAYRRWCWWAMMRECQGFGDKGGYDEWRRRDRERLGWYKEILVNLGYEKESEDSAEEEQEDEVF